MIIRLLSHTFFILNFYHIKWDFWVFRGFAISRNTQFPQYSHAISRARQRYSKPSENEELSSAYLQVKRSINDVCQKDHLRFLRFLRFCRILENRKTAITAHSRSATRSLFYITTTATTSGARQHCACRKGTNPTTSTIILAYGRDLNYLNYLKDHFFRDLYTC